MYFKYVYLLFMLIHSMVTRKHNFCHALLLSYYSVVTGSTPDCKYWEVLPTAQYTGRSFHCPVHWEVFPLPSTLGGLSTAQYTAQGTIYRPHTAQYIA